jgi:hypothetical protein
MSSSQDPVHAARLTSRQRESADKRIRMTRRRQELTSRIRKQKKSLYLQNKRSLGTTGDNNVTTTHNGTSIIPSSLKTLLRSYCQSPASTSPEQFLSTLENFIATTISTNNSVYEKKGNPLLLLEQDDESLALQFLDCLRDNITNVNELSFTSALKILVHFTSIDSSSMSSSSTSSEYYGRLPLTWSELVVTLPSNSKSNTTACPSWLEILVQALSSSKEVELTCLVLGNLVGDGSFRSVSVNLKESMVVSLVRSVSPATPTAAWTLTNMIRNDSFSYASSYCSETLLSTSRLSAWLREPTIATQTAWMIASLTAREEQAVQYLCQPQQQNERSFLSTLVMSVQNPLQHDQTVPLIQALGNIACHASLITPLLTQTMPPLIPLLQQILTTTSSRDPLLVQAAWLAGCLLVDVGIENHPSTICAAPALIPILMNRLGGENNCGRGTGQMTITMTTLEEEREFTSALWNALAAPPIDEQQQVQQSSQQMEFLTNHTSQSPPVHLPFNLNVPRSALQTLVRLIDSKDFDAILASVHVVDLLLRREDHYSSSFHPHQNLQTIMQEEELPDALERVCDSSIEEAADIAADIIDNYFTNEQNSNEDSSPQDRVAESSSGFSASPSTFAFGIGSETRLSDGAGRGRGRGAMIPAWMTK